MLKPIETVYKDFRFRSRLEARWAVFFDTAGVLYEYEKQGYDLDAAGWYLPDFWLPAQKAWVEIKGRDPLDYEIRQFCTLASEAKRPLFVFAGDINPAIQSYFAHPAHPPSGFVFLEPCMFWVECLRCHQKEIICADREPCDQCGGVRSRATPRLLAAYRAARQARFEF